MDDKTLMSAIKQIREHIGLTQPEFAEKYFKRKLSAQQRYETLRAPRDVTQLVVLRNLAIEKGRPDLAQVFTAAIIQTVPREVLQVIQESMNQPKGGRRASG